MLLTYPMDIFYFLSHTRNNYGCHPSSSTKTKPGLNAIRQNNDSYIKDICGHYYMSKLLICAEWFTLSCIVFLSITHHVCYLQTFVEFFLLFIFTRLHLKLFSFVVTTLEHKRSLTCVFLYYSDHVYFELCSSLHSIERDLERLRKQLQ